MADIAFKFVEGYPPPAIQPMTVDAPFVSRRLAEIHVRPDLRYLNRVWDTVAGGFVSWRTGDPDATGSLYPGPGSFGVDTSDYCVERLRVPERG